MDSNIARISDGVSSSGLERVSGIDMASSRAFSVHVKLSGHLVSKHIYVPYFFFTNDYTFIQMP